MKKILYSFGTLAAIATPVSAVVACGSHDVISAQSSITITLEDGSAMKTTAEKMAAAVGSGTTVDSVVKTGDNLVVTMTKPGSSVKRAATSKEVIVVTIALKDGEILSVTKNGVADDALKTSLDKVADDFYDEVIKANPDFKPAPPATGGSGTAVVPAPPGAIVGMNYAAVAATGDGSGSTYTAAQIAARDASGPYPADAAAAAKAIVGENTPEGVAGAEVPATGDGSGNSYTQAQIDQVLGGDKVAPANAISGKNVAAVTATGDGSGNTYTQAQIDHATGGDKVAPAGAVVSVNSPAVVATGDGSGHTYTQAQIDKALGGDKVAPAGAIDGENVAAVEAVNFSQDEAKAYLSSLVTDGPFDLSSATIITGAADDSAATKTEVLSLITSLTSPLTTAQITAILVELSITAPDSIAKATDIVKTPAITATGDGSGKTYTAAQIAARDATGDVPADAAAAAKAIVGLNIAPKDAVGDGTGNTYTAAQIAARDATGTYPTDPTTAKVGENVAAVTATGDGSGKTYTDAQIAARDATGNMPADAATAANAIVGLNQKHVPAGEKPPAVGDGSGNTYSQAQIDHALGGTKVAPTGAIAGKNVAAVVATGDGSGNSYSQAQIDARDNA